MLRCSGDSNDSNDNNDNNDRPLVTATAGSVHNAGNTLLLPECFCSIASCEEIASDTL